jgi:hypothetical protein
MSRARTSEFDPTRDIGATRYAYVPPLWRQCASLDGRKPLCNGREEALHFFPQIRDRLAIAREMPQQASLEESIK